jgi:hypothetical protein
MGKGTFILGLGVGYVLGTRAGRERYEQIKERATGAWNNPQVQRKVTVAEQTARNAVDSATQKVGERLPGGGSDEPEPSSREPAGREPTGRERAGTR